MLRTVKLLALVAMFFVALASSAQVTTSALSGVVTDENQQAMIGTTITALHTPSGTKYNAVTNIDGRYTIRGMPPDAYYTANDNLHTGDWYSTIISEQFWLSVFMIIFYVAIILILAVLTNKNIKIKYSDFDMEIGSKEEKVEKEEKEEKS